MWHYHLYAALIFPLTLRTLVARKLKGLEEVISISVVEPRLTDEGWRSGNHPGFDRDEVNGASYLHELYSRADPDFTGRATVPVLWDRKRGTIVSNESADIVRRFDTGFGSVVGDTLDLCPEEFRQEIEALNERIYPSLNNGLYQAGFATTQEAYDQAFNDVFGMLDELETRLDGSAFLIGKRLTETDILLFVTLVRFDAAYHGLFKCNLRRLLDYPTLSAHVERMLSTPGVAEKVDIDHIKEDYYSIRSLNPTGIVPLGPRLPFAHLLGRR